MIGGGGISNRVIAGWIVFLTIVVLALTVPVVSGVLRAGRWARRAAHDPSRRIGLAWRESKDAVRLMGIPVQASDTPRELAARVESRNREAGRSLGELAEDVTTATYADGVVLEDRADRAEMLSESLAAQARAHTGRVSWWSHHMNPVNVWLRKAGLWGHLRPRPRSVDERREPGAGR